VLYNCVNTIVSDKGLGVAVSERTTFSDPERTGLIYPMAHGACNVFNGETEVLPALKSTSDELRGTTQQMHLMETEDSQDSTTSDASDTTVELDGRSFCNVLVCPADKLDSETDLCASGSNVDRKTSPDSSAWCDQRTTSCGGKLQDFDGRRADGSDPLTGCRSMSSSLNKISFYSKQKHLPDSTCARSGQATSLSDKKCRTGGKPPSEASSDLSNVDKIGFEAEAVSARMGQWQNDCVVTAAHERRCPTKGRREVRRLFIDENTPGAKRELRSFRRGVGVGGGPDRVQRRHSSPLRSRPVIRTTATLGRHAQHQRLLACKRTAENQNRC
jgi:hypothetical protein